MRKQFYLLPILASIIICFSGCEKDKNDTPEKTRTELISENTWKFQSAAAMGMDVSGSIDACIKDNILTISANGTGAVAESTLVCTPSTAGNFTWSFQSNETKIQSSVPLFPGGGTTFDIVTLTETTLVVSQEMTIAPFPPTVVTVTLVH